jgi:hypothetical protein
VKNVHAARLFAAANGCVREHHEQREHLSDRRAATTRSPSSPLKTTPPRLPR